MSTMIDFIIKLTEKINTTYVVFIVKLIINIPYFAILTNPSFFHKAS
jgi:hypothetical protein